MMEKIRILHLEDREEDCLAIIENLIQNGIHLTYRRVEKLVDFHEALDKENWDIILADYSLEGFTGLDALRIYHEKKLDIPFIMVTGVMREDEAALAYRNGADDFVSKQNLTRLAPVIQREMRDYKIKKAQYYTQLKAKRIEGMARKILATIPSGVFTVTEDFNIITWNAEAELITGIPQKEVIGKPCYEIFDCCFINGKCILFDKETKLPARGIECTVNTPNGKRYVTKNIDLVYDDKKKILHGLESFIDITESKKVQTELKESEEKYRELIESQGEGIGITDLNDTFLFANPAAEDIFGVERGTLVGRNLREFLDDDESEKLLEMVRQQKKASKKMYELKIHRPDGDFRILIVSTTQRFSKENKLIGFFGIFRDITQKRLALKALEESEAKLRAITSSAQDAIIMIDPEGIVCYWNQAAALMLGYEERDIVGKNLHRMLTPKRYYQEHKRHFAEFQRSGKGNVVGKTTELEAVRADGTEIPVELSLSSIQLEERWYAIGIMRDISERKTAERDRERLTTELSSQFHLSQIGLLVSGITHNIRTPLSIIAMYSSSMNKQVSDLLSQGTTSPFVLTETLEKVENALIKIEQGADRINAILNDIGSYHQINREDYGEITDLNNVIQTDIAMMKSDLDIKHKIAMNVVLCPGAINVTVRPSDIGQIFLNLISNARDALMNVSDREITIKTGIDREENKGWFEVIDSGPGFNEKILADFGKPFNTSKIHDEEARKRGSGTGLGIYMVHRILNQVDGKIAVKSKPGETIIRITIPLADSREMQMTDTGENSDQNEG